MKKKIIHTNKVFKDRRKELRNNSTKEEVLLWIQIKNRQLGSKFQRQHSIGPYIADFYCPEKKLIIEIDGSQHLENIEYDQERTRYFDSLGIRELRFWNNEINTNIDGVLMKVKEELEK